MLKKCFNQSGFGASVLIVAVLVISVISGAGYVFYMKTSTTKKDSVNTAVSNEKESTTKTAAKPEQATQQPLVIKEWGVQLTVDDTTSSLYYNIKPNIPNVAYLSLKTMSDVAPKCAADQISLAAIARLTEAEQETALKSSSSRPGTIHIGNYWYSYSQSHASCIETSAQNDAISKVQPSVELKKVFTSLQSTPASSSTN